MNSTQFPVGAVVVAVDGSEEASRAVSWAARDAQLEGRPLAVVHVGGNQATGPPVLADAIAVAHEQDPELDVHARSATGQPAEVLVELSERAHLLVLGSRGLGGVRSRVLGSVSMAVAAHAVCPVVICRPTDEPFAKTALVVGADGSEDSLPVIEFAFRQAELRQMPLHVVHCYADASTRHWRRSTPVDKDGLRLMLAESVAGMADKFPDVTVTLRLDNDTVAEALNRGMRPWEMVVVGRRRVSDPHRERPGTAADVLTHSDSPVAIVPELGTTAPEPHQRGASRKEPS